MDEKLEKETNEVKETLDELFGNKCFDYCKMQSKENIYKTIVKVLILKNDCITKIRYFNDIKKMKINLYIYFGSIYCWFELPYEDFYENTDRTQNVEEESTNGSR